MQIRMMSTREVASTQPKKTTKAKPALSEHAKFIKKMKVGRQYEVKVSDLNIKRQSVKLQLAKAAAEANVKIKFIRSGPDVVWFTRA